MTARTSIILVLMLPACRTTSRAASASRAETRRLRRRATRARCDRVGQYSSACLRGPARRRANRADRPGTPTQRHRHDSRPHARCRSPPRLALPDRSTIKVVPGTVVLAARRDDPGIRRSIVRAEEVRITTTDSTALSALRDFWHSACRRTPPYQRSLRFPMDARLTCWLRLRGYRIVNRWEWFAVYRSGPVR
jgi:hypothetical protein